MEKLTLDIIFRPFISVVCPNDTFDNMKVGLALSFSFPRNHVLFVFFRFEVFPGDEPHVGKDGGLEVVV
jgi:hypothetical protein